MTIAVNSGVIGSFILSLCSTDGKNDVCVYVCVCVCLYVRACGGVAARARALSCVQERERD